MVTPDIRIRNVSVEGNSLKTVSVYTSMSITQDLAVRGRTNDFLNVNRLTWLESVLHLPTVRCFALLLF